MKKLFTLLFSSICILSTVNAQEWNITSASFNALGTITAPTTVEGLTVYATSDATVVIDANNKSWNGLSFTSRLKLGGTGGFDATTLAPLSRVLAFPVTGPTEITIAAMSSSSGSDRLLNIRTADNIAIGEFSALGASLSGQTYSYSGGANTIYIYSPSSGVNIYYLKAVSTGPSNLNPAISNAKVVRTVFYGISGKVAGENFNALKKGAYIQKTTYDNGAVIMSKFLKSVD